MRCHWPSDSFNIDPEGDELLDSLVEANDTILECVVSCIIDLSGLEINFFVWEPAGDQRKNFGRQIVNFGRQLILYITTQKHDFISCFLSKKSHNFRAATTKLPLFSGDVSGPKVMVVSIVILNEAKHKTF